MPKRAWYLTDVDLDVTSADAPQLPIDALIDDLTDWFGDPAAFSPAHTATAVHIANLMTQHLGDSIAHLSGLDDIRDVDRLITGLNVLVAQLAQTLQRLAYHVDRHDLPGLHGAPAGLTADVTESIARAGSNGELVAGHLKEAHLTLWQLTAQPTAS
jgi:hypothetical protein